MEERFETFTVLINRISRSIKKLKNLEMAEYGLRGVHVSCIYYLYLTDNMTATELCERCEEDKATISRSLDELESGGYLICVLKSAKRYNSPLVLTERGRQIGREIADKVNAVLDEVGVGMTEEERCVLYRSLTLICDSLERCVQNMK